MSQTLQVGARLHSTACSTEVVVVKAPDGAVDLRCGGAPLVEEATDATAELDAQFSEGTALGKRYTDEESGIELLAVKAGDGSLSIDGRALVLKGAKPLPASD